MCVCVPFARLLLEEDTRFPRAGVTGGGESPYRHKDLKSDPEQQQPLLLTVEPFLQHFLFFFSFLKIKSFSFFPVVIEPVLELAL